MKLYAQTAVENELLVAGIAAARLAANTCHCGANRGSILRLDADIQVGHKAKLYLWIIVFQETALLQRVVNARIGQRMLDLLQQKFLLTGANDIMIVFILQMCGNFRRRRLEYDCFQMVSLRKIPERRPVCIRRNHCSIAADN